MKWKQEGVEGRKEGMGNNIGYMHGCWNVEDR
jgi:hypothetical protein